ncbi:Protein OS-9 like [Melia azedarach]|uniref:Protein OS-9 like n=2 Tax=Melia azedarach TaxID=155640 RepID=A0ACC1YDI0_MELAZ|nr:Protein OS-9 like [Melia azedarach]KAJ4721437.1 Protein OS-9 like [Melia azedarach]
MTNHYNLSRNSLFFIYLLLASTLMLSPVLAKSRRPITDSETRQKKLDCYADVESGLWGRQCKSSMIAKENCALRCLSPTCYELIYESDPLEEGEKDFVRSQEFKYCMHKLSLGESLEGIRGAFDY